jgi:hypothetical protein
MLKIKILFFTVVYTFLFSTAGFSQTSDFASINLSGFVATCYTFYHDSVGEIKYEKFPSDFTESNQFGLHAACLTAQYDGAKVRGLISLHYGDSANGAWLATIPDIIEAQAGVQMCKTLWLDACRL